MVESILRMNHVVKAYECNWKGELSLSHVVGIMMLASRKQERSLAKRLILDCYSEPINGKPSSKIRRRNYYRNGTSRI